MPARHLAIILALLLTVAGCERPSPPPTVDGAMRIVCLAPALTQMVIDLELRDALVGVGQNDAAAPGVRVVGTYTDINPEALAGVAPTHVLLQAGISGPPATLVEQSAAGRFKLLSYPYPRSILDVADILHRASEDGPPGVGSFLDRPDEAAAMRETMLARIDAIRRLTAGRPRPRVLMIIYAQPLTASGGDTVLNDMLDAAGGVNAAPQNASAPTLDREKLLGIDPDVVLLMLYDTMPLGPLETDHRVALFRGPGLQAYANHRIHKIDDSQALLPTTTMPRIIAAMAKHLHPELAVAIDAAVAQEKSP